MKKSKILALVMIVTLLVSCFVGCGDDKNGDGSEDLKYQEEHNDSGLSNVAVGEYIKFGKYEQDNDESNGKEDIEWLVLDKQDNKVLVVSKYALDCKPYHEEEEDVTWEECTLRTWLNNDFVNTAFLEDEKSNIATVTIVNDDNQEYNKDGGNDTQDKVFLLSIDEVEKYLSSYDERMCSATDYVEAQGIYVSDTFVVDGKGTCKWWLRSIGNSLYSAVDVYHGGKVHENGNLVHADNGVRPALWINLE